MIIAQLINSGRNDAYLYYRIYFNMRELILPIQSTAKLKLIANPKKHAMILEAINFPSKKDLNDKVITTLYSFNNFDIKVGKPGKEFGLETIKYKDGLKRNNPNDMLPMIFEKGLHIQRVGSFDEVFRKISTFAPDYNSLEILGSLLIRNAFLLDHILDKNGSWRYNPPKKAIEELNKNLPKNFGEPIEVFLHYLELIALNEDVKYHTLGHDVFGTGVGRYNNLMTYVNIIDILIENRDLSSLMTALLKFAGGMARIPTGLNQISFKKAKETFKFLG
jgi:hypothetical protein